MKIAIQSYNGNSMEAIGGGEHRWSLNWAEFLRLEGHSVDFKRGNGDDAGYDLLLDSPDDCSKSAAKVHVHNKFGPGRNSLVHFPCASRGEMKMSVPYKEKYETIKDEFLELGVEVFFLPMCYPDIWLPGEMQTPFERTGIVWAK